jgi:hypothetical protein
VRQATPVISAKNNQKKQDFQLTQIQEYLTNEAKAWCGQVSL